LLVGQMVSSSFNEVIGALPQTPACQGTNWKKNICRRVKSTRIPVFRDSCSFSEGGSGFLNPSGAGLFTARILRFPHARRDCDKTSQKNTFSLRKKDFLQRSEAAPTRSRTAACRRPETGGVHTSVGTIERLYRPLKIAASFRSMFFNPVRVHR